MRGEKMKKLAQISGYLIIFGIVIIIAFVAYMVIFVPEEIQEKSQEEIEMYEYKKEICEGMTPLEVHNKLQGFREGVKFDIVDTDYKTEFFEYSATCGIRANLCVEEYAETRLCYEVILKV